MPVGDQAVGAVLLLISFVVFIYYTVWVILTPFIDKDHYIQSLFLPYHYAMIIPAVLLVLLITLSGTFVGLVMIRSKKKKKSD